MLHDGKWSKGNEKQVLRLRDLIIEDAFIESINGDEKEAKKMDTTIDAIIDDRYDMLSRVSNYPKNEKRAKVTEHFNAIKTDLDAKVSDYSKKIGRVK